MKRQHNTGEPPPPCVCVQKGKCSSARMSSLFVCVLLLSNCRTLLFAKKWVCRLLHVYYKDNSFTNTLVEMHTHAPTDRFIIPKCTKLLLAFAKHPYIFCQNVANSCSCQTSIYWVKMLQTEQRVRAAREVPPNCARGKYC